MVRDSFQTVQENLPLVLLASVVLLVSFVSDILMNMAGQDIAVIGFVISLLVLVAQYGIYSVLYIRHYNKRAKTDIDGLVRFKRRVLSLIGVVFVSGTLMLIGLVLFVIPGLYLMYKLFLAVPICIIEDERLVPSLKKSWRYTDGLLWKVTGVALVMFVFAVPTGLTSMAFAAGSFFSPFLLVGLVLLVVAAFLQLVAQVILADLAIEAAELA